jgi:two-component system response regulator (stage 0 sporulation protein A)
MNELRKTVEALKLCVGQEALEKALETLRKQGEAAQQPLADPDTEQVISELLMEIGMPTHIKGYGFCITAIKLLVDRPELADGITKWLYPEIARIHDSTLCRVERAIRHGIEVAWSRCDVDVLVGYFRNTVDPNRCKPTNSEFLTRMAHIAKRKLG